MRYPALFSWAGCKAQFAGAMLEACRRAGLRGFRRVVSCFAGTAAFEVEHTTSIYSGIVRMLDLALGVPDHAGVKLFLVAPDAREDDVRQQLARPAFRRVADLSVRFLPYGELERNRESMARFGTGLKAVEAVSRVLV